jgi:glucose/arabinose dehydrogenase
MPRRLVPLAVTLLALSLAPAARAQEVELEPVVTDLGFASNLAFAPDGTGFLTEKDLGQILILRDGRLLDEPFATLPVRVTANETGLLGIAVHPDFPDEPWVYAYYSDVASGRNLLVRIRAEGDRGTDVETVLELLPFVSGYHNGGDIAFGPDGKLYVATGEAHQPDRAQDPDDLGGKILRLNPDGSVPDDNPFPGSPVFALGIRNSFGLCFDRETGELWETENGPDRFDEVNLIHAGANYGWPLHLGPAGADGFEDPILAYETVIVPTGCAHEGFTAGGGLYFGTYGGELHRVRVPGGTAEDRSARDDVVARVGGGITDVASGPDGRLYVVTSDAVYARPGEEPSATTPTSGPSGTGPTGSGTGSTTASPSPGADGGGRLSPATIVIALVLLGGLYLARRRMGGGR